MSSFIVEDSTINRIVNFCYWEHDSILKHEIERQLKNIGIDLHKDTEDEEIDKTLRKFGEELLKLNVMAFYVRYKHIDKIKEEIKEAIKNYVFEDTPLKDRQQIQVLKSLECFLYQCSEGEIDKEPLYKTLEEIKNILTSHIINKLPEYEKAIWG